MNTPHRKPVWMVRLFTGVTQTEGVDRFSFISGDRDMFGYPRAVSKVSPIAPSVDEVTGRFSSGDWRVEFDDQTGGLDSALRRLLVERRMRNKLISFFRGEQSLPSDLDFLDVGRGIVKTARGNGRRLTLVAYDAAGILARKDISGDDATWTNQHPLEIIQSILNLANVPTTLYDATTLDPSSAEYISGDHAISHFNVTRANKTPQFINQEVRIKNSVNALQLVNELCEMMGGSFVANRAGVYGFKLYTGLTGNYRTLGTDDYKGELDNDVLGTMKNRWNYFTHKSDEGFSGKHITKDEDSISDHAIPGAVDGIEDGKLESHWINGFGHFRNQGAASPALPASAGEDDEFEVVDAGISGFSGCRYNSGGTTRPTWAEPSDPDRLIYILIRGFTPAGLRAEEVMSIKDITLATNINPGSNALETTSEEGVTYRRVLSFFIKERGLAGTTAQDFGAGLIHKVYDLTPQFRGNRIRVERFSYGPPRVRVPLDARNIDLEVLDQVRIPDARLIDFGKDGEDTTGIYGVQRIEDHGDKVIVDLAKIPATVVGTVVVDPPEYWDPAIPTNPLKRRSDGNILIERSTGDTLYARSHQ